MVRSRVDGTLLVAAAILIVVALIPRAMAWPPPGALPAGPPANKLDAAAGALDAAVMEGAGYSFEVAQSQTLRAKADGPSVVVNGRQVQEHRVSSRLARGVVTRQGYWSEMRLSADPWDPDFESGRFMFAALVLEKDQYRDDGRGWQETDVLPGFGLDSAAGTRLPSLLRNASGAATTDTRSTDGGVIQKVTATARLEDVPGVVASDGVGFTELVAPVELSLDATGRLVGLRIVAHNTNETRYELVVESQVWLDYEFVPPLPDPAFQGGAVDRAEQGEESGR